MRLTMRHFAWDKDKAAANLRKHRLGFLEAVRVFDDEHAKDEILDEPDEVRWQRTGEIGEGTVAVVIYTEWEEGEDQVVRIISARFARRSERRRYYESA